MKRTLALLLAVVMMAAMFAGCGKSEPAPTQAPKATEAQAAATEAVETEAADPYAAPRAGRVWISS